MVANSDMKPVGHIEISPKGRVYEINKYYDNADENSTEGFSQFFEALKNMIWVERGSLSAPPFPTSILADVSVDENGSHYQRIDIMVGKRRLSVSVYRTGVGAPSVTFQESIEDFSILHK
jgi:hypothetical protein